MPRKTLAHVFNSIRPLRSSDVAIRSWVTSTLTVIVNGHAQSQIDDLLPWN
jgi:hypothetical protein